MRGVIRFSSAEAERQLHELRQAKERLDEQAFELQMIIHSLPADTRFLRECRSDLRKRLRQTEESIVDLLRLFKALRDVGTYFEELERKLAAGLGGMTGKVRIRPIRPVLRSGSYWHIAARRSFLRKYASRIWRRSSRYRTIYRNRYRNRYRLRMRSAAWIFRRAFRSGSYRYGYYISGLRRRRIKYYLMRRTPVYRRMRIFTPDWLRRLF